jgi:uncharacterized protein
MFSFLRTFALFCILNAAWVALAVEARAACVWKVSAADGRVLYLGGSFHGLLSTDYPLPSAYNRAFDSSSRLVFEEDASASPASTKSLFKSALYPKNDNLKNHIDPRVYDYLRRVFSIWNVPEAQFSKFRPWGLEMLFLAQGTNSLGVESYLISRARANHKPISGLESFREHIEIVSSLTDRQAELVLLAGFIPQAPGTDRRKQLIDAWRKGDVDTIDRLERTSYQDLPSFYQRLITNRNDNWLPKIERYLQGRETCFVVAGAGHMGGPHGILALLKGRGYKIDEL